MTDLLKRECRGCGRPLIFAPTDDGKIVPLDPSPPVYELVTDLAGKQTAVRVKDTFVSHFATCPRASEFGTARKPPAAAQGGRR